MTTPTMTTINELLRYKEGRLYWRVQPARNVPARSRAGSLSAMDKYETVYIKGKRYLTHRLVFLMHKGYLPKRLDHKDGNKLNNCIGNLRECTASQNSMNGKIRTNNKSGLTGVTWNKKYSKWQSWISIDKKLKCLGGFTNIFDAACSRISAQNKHYGAFSRVGG